MRRHQRAVTMVEVIVVSALIAILAAIVYGVFGPARERARQINCAEQLRQIYSAMQLYSADNPGPNVHPAVPLVDPISSANLLTYLGNDRSILYCPDSTPKMRQQLFSSYLWLITSFRNASPEALAKQVDDAYRRYDSKLPIVDCTIHDEVYYYPREREVSPLFAKAFIIHLGASGSVFSDRVRGHKRDFFEQFLK